MNEILENKEMKIENKPKEIQDLLNTTSKKVDFLLNPKTISKIKDNEGRQELLQTVKILKGFIKEKKKELFVLDNTLILESSIIQKQKELVILKQDVDILIKSKFRIKDKRVIERENEILDLQKQLENNILEVEYFKIDLKLFQKDINKKIKEKIENYYLKIDKAILTKEEKQEFLTPEFLSNISTGEYMQLWKKLNTYFVSHVTRQGYRDHIGMSGHTGGFNEFANGFKDMLEDEKSLKPPIHIGENGLKSRDEEGVKNYLKDILKNSKTKEEAYENLYEQLHFTLASSPKYPDKTAIHFAGETVLNDLYGGENDNEIFLIYPSDFIVSQYSFSFNGGQKDFTKPQSDATWNDIFVWPNTLENPSIGVDAGIVFLPENTLVDKNTGSKYIKDENGNLIQVGEENSITSKEYWEKYFANNLDKKPAHIVYYNGEPNEAINNFLYEFDEKNPDKICLIKTENTDENNKLLGFDENHIKDIYNDPKSNMGYDELVNIGVKIINDFYEQKN